jgi:tetratricopeptide (TPR) repeat protein
MNLHASQSEIDALEGVLRRAVPGEGVVATKVALAWHLRQRDSARTLKLVQDVMPVVRASRSSTHGDAIASCHARAALAAAEASALYGEVTEAERCLLDARAHLDASWDPQAEGDTWLVEAVVARTRGQVERSLAALRQARLCFDRTQDRERLAIARAWIEFENMASRPEGAAPGDAIAETVDGGEMHVARDAILVAARAFALSCRNPAAATRAFTRAGDLAQARGLVLLEVTCLLETGAAIHELGDYDRAARCFDAAALRARATGWPTLMVTCDTHFGALLCDLGAFDESRRTLEAAIESLSARPRGPLLGHAHAALARTLLATHRTAEALAQMDAAMALFRAADSLRDLASNLILHARVLAAAAQPGRAVDVLAEAESLVESRGLEAMRVRLHQAQADLHHRFTLAPPAVMTLPSAALHFAESALVHGQRLTGWSPRATLLDFLAERWADAGEHQRAYAYARRALGAKERETDQKMSYPLALLRVRRHAEVRAGPEQTFASNDRDAARAPGEASGLFAGRAPRTH